MSNINIQMKQRNGAIWDNLYPKTKAENVEESTAKQFASNIEKSSWNAKQDALGFTPENIAKKGVANGYAELDTAGKVPASQLPSYVDDVLEFSNQVAFPATGETGKIYIAQDNNKTFRWSGTAYIEISASIALGETTSTAYRGDRGKTAYDHSQSNHAPANAQKNSDITKAEIESKLVGTITSHTHTGLVPANHGSNHVTGGSDVIPNAVADGSSGLMSGVDKSKLDGILEGANNYTHPVTAGNKHIPTGGAADQVLMYGGSSGTAKWDKITVESIGATKITVAASAPSSPAGGDFWYEII